MKRLILSVCLAGGAAWGQIGELVAVRPDGTVTPSNYVATVQTLAENAAGVQAAIAQAQAVAAAAGAVSNAVAGIEALENARNSTGYIRGFVESFSPGIEADTNLTASIVKFEKGAETASNVTWNIYTYFTSNPGAWPVVRTTESAGRTNAWDELDSSSVVMTNVLVGSTLYEAYCNQVVMPLATTAAFFRVFCDLQGNGTNAMYFPVRNGIAVNGVLPLTATISEGTNTMRWIGGVRVQ